MRYTTITLEEMETFLAQKGFRRMQLPGVFELVFGKRVDQDGHELTIRVYTTVDASSGMSREKGSDSIKVCLWQRKEGRIRMVGMEARVLRTQGWRANLGRHLDYFQKLIPPLCLSCKEFMVARKSRHGGFLERTKRRRAPSTRSSR